MTGGDWLAAGILGGFVLLSLLGLLKWIFRVMAGAALGAVLLIVLGQAGGIPQLSATSAMLNRGRITPAMHHRAKQAAAAVGLLPGDSRIEADEGSDVHCFPVPPEFHPSDPTCDRVEYQWRRDPGNRRGDPTRR
jgi:hypothetical protein